MNAETLGALATIVNEAIAKAVQPLQRRIAELEGRKGYDDTDIRTGVKGLLSVAELNENRLKALEGRRAPEPFDPSALESRIAQFEKDAEAFKTLVEALPIPAPAYNDSELREQIKTLVSSHAKDVEALLQRIPKAYDDAPLRQWVTEQIKALPEPTVTHGTDGKDALALEVLPEIDQAKSYVRNTYAKHNGGLWRSFEQTHGMRGWECVVDGVHAVMPAMEGKSLTVRVIQSSGTESMLMADLPIQEYKGVFRPEGEYVAHDTATWAGSLWHCNVTGTKAKPGDGSSDWTLAVKKGRDAKEVVRV